MEIRMPRPHSRPLRPAQPVNQESAGVRDRNGGSGAIRSDTEPSTLVASDLVAHPLFLLRKGVAIPSSPSLAIYQKGRSRAQYDTNILKFFIRICPHEDSQSVVI